ncbi:hypothetical protein NE237_032354 [Protea cynaroides]|uniref:Uncharacterized protein n=1 Tax=Protea cynaroides TaxID=273540 RepID=A0A9Q0L2Y3_9MAGN|nr:hypothetical protein NE237_032354 [Protea cynaroides]
MNQKRNALPPQLMEDPVAMENIFREVVGPDGHGRVRCSGIGVTPKSLGLTKTNLEVECRVTQSQERMREEITLKVTHRIKEEMKHDRQEMERQLTCKDILHSGQWSQMKANSQNSQFL